MLRAILLRLAGAIPVLFLVACGIFALLHLAPGDAASMLASSDAGPDEVEKLRQLWGLDRPLYVQFGKFLLNVIHLDLGTSLRYQQPVITMIAERLPATLELAVVTLIIAVGVGVPLGIAAALNKGNVPISRPATPEIITTDPALFGQNLPNLIIALTIQRWIPYARLTRAQA